MCRYLCCFRNKIDPSLRKPMLNIHEIYDNDPVEVISFDDILDRKENSYLKYLANKIISANSKG